MTKIMNVFNASERDFYVEKDGKTVTLSPKTNLEIAAKQAEKLMAMYPKDLIPAGSVVEGKLDAKAYKALEAKYEALLVENEALKVALKDVTVDVEDSAIEDEFSKMTKKELTKLFDANDVKYETDANVGRLREIARIDKATALAEAATA